LADPYAKPNEALVEDVDVLLRGVALSLLEGNVDAIKRAAHQTTNMDKEGLKKCLAYLRNRVGVPRDMTTAAAMYFRAHLNEAIVSL
jgi:glutathione S-transferase